MIQYFDFSMSEEGYWNYNHVALQVEGVFNVFSIKYLSFDFLLMLDQSSGHGHTREGALNMNQMSIKWGGK